MSRQACVSLLALLAAAGCDRGGDAQFQDSPASEAFGVMNMLGGEAPMESERRFAQLAAPAPPPADALGGADGVDQTTAEQLADAGTLLAYSYSTAFEVPARNVEPLMSVHEEACRAAGVAVCQVLSANVNASGPTYVNAQLSLRAEPGWLETFRARLEDDAETADGRITNEGVYAEDLTRAIVDTEARLRAQLILRERLEALLASQSEDVGDLLAVERELARVQGEIDSAQSNLEVMRRRVDMSTMDLSYSSAPVALSQNAFAPLGRAINDFFGVFARSAGALVSLVAAALPFVLIGAPLAWLARGWLMRRRRRKAAAASGEGVAKA